MIMGRDDEWIRGDGWIRGDAAHHAEYGETTGVPGTGWTTVWGAGADEDAEDEDEADEDDWPEDSLDDGWPNDDDDWLDDESPEDEWLDGKPFAMPGGPPGPGYWRGWGHGGVPGFSTWMAVAVAVVAGVVGVAVGFFLTRGAPVASATGGVSGSMPAVSAPASVPAPGPASTGGGAGPQDLPGLPGSASGNGNGQLRILLTGRVLAVSATSVTIGGAGPSVTAAVTSTTKLTGHVHGLGGVKVGDEIAAQLTGTPSHLVITTLQDPAQ
jgi:hypothetical protein